jgi:hypothetical protein
MKVIFFFFFLLANAGLISCSNCYRDGNVFNNLVCKDEPSKSVESQKLCPDPDDKSINGLKYEDTVTLDRPGDWTSQIHFETVEPHYGFHRLSWSVGINRQSCSGGGPYSEGFNSYLKVSKSPISLGMQVVPGDNYFDYAAYGCRTPKEEKCTELVESGTIVLHVNWIP